jgi:hypothetical protein
MWVPVFGLVVNEQWQYSPAIAVAGEYFRFNHFYSELGYSRGLMCQADTLQPFIHFATARLYPSSEMDVYRLVSPDCFDSRSIGVRSIDQSIKPWTIFVDVWISAMPLSNQPNYPVSTVAASTTVASSITSVPVLAANPIRKGATIWNASTATLYLDLDTAATTTDYAARLDPNGYYEVPYGFTGALSGIWNAANGNALVREFT